MVQEPTTPEEMLDMHKIPRKDTQRYLQIVNDSIRENPDNPYSYYSRHLGWMRVGEPRRALDDLGTSIALAPRQRAFEARAGVHRHLGEYEAALQDYQRGEALDAASYAEGFSLLFQADCHARSNAIAIGSTQDSRSRLPGPVVGTS